MCGMFEPRTRMSSFSLPAASTKFAMKEEKKLILRIVLISNMAIIVIAYDDMH
jgi:hypothetical protein